MSVPTPNWILNEEHSMHYGSYDTKTLPEGTFARPLALEYVPQYVKELPINKHFDEEREVYCYTSIGIIRIPKFKLVKI